MTEKPKLDLVSLVTDEAIHQFCDTPERYAVSADFRSVKAALLDFAKHVEGKING